MNLIILTGPTASGKTSLSFELAKKYPIEIISADSRQVFKYLDIGTAKPTKEELEKVPHHFIDIVEPDEYYSAGKFGEQAYKKVKDIYNSGKIPLVVGGSGLYIKALVEGLFEEDSDDNLIEIRKNLEEEYREKGSEFLEIELCKVDPENLEMYSDKNPRRLIRALSYFNAKGKKFSEVQKEKIQVRDLEANYFAIDHTREILYERINQRTLEMWDQGFEQECKKVLAMGYDPKLNSLDSVGYRECIHYIDGEIGREEAIEEMQKFTRRFAKRQITWIKNQTPDCVWLPSDLNSQVKEIEKAINLNK